MVQISDYSGKHVHMIGIGGSSMSGLAELLQEKGYIVSGSDSAHSYLTQRLIEKGITVTIGQNAKNIEGADIVIYSAAIHPDNPERAAASAAGIPQMERATLLGQLMSGFSTAINICGTHGKTTTTSMVSEILIDAGKDPTIHIGGQLDYIGGSTKLGDPDLMVVEACEYQASFLQFHPTIAVITNIEEDHLDYYKDLDDIYRSFCRFASLLPPDGWCLGNGDDPLVCDLLRKQTCHTASFGLDPVCDWRPVNIVWDENGCAEFDVLYREQLQAHLHLSIPGEFNMLHAVAAVACTSVVGVSPETAAASLSRFQAPHRRFELTGTVCGVKLYTDYAHNPAEMQNAVSNAYHQPHNRLWAVIQPHTYSRLKTLFDDYIHCCDLADEILVTDIFAAREKDPGDIHSTMLVDAIAKTGQSVHYTAGFDDAESYLRSHWQPGDLVITMSCGNINLLNQQIQDHGDTWPDPA